MQTLWYAPRVVPSDLELLERWRGGDAAAGEDLFERHFDAVVRFFRNKTDEAAEDLVQQTFLGCMRGQQRFRGDASFRTYLFVVAHNVLKNHYRRRGRAEAEVDFSVSSVFDLAPSPSLIVARRQEHQRLLEGLRRIPLELQVALELHYWEGLSATEIGIVLELPAGTVKTRLRRAKQLVRERMDALAALDSPAPEATEADLEAWARAVRGDLLAQ
jgi:RNA polymerase sigma factor (sigma-70 family)